VLKEKVAGSVPLYVKVKSISIVQLLLYIWTVSLLYVHVYYCIFGQFPSYMYMYINSFPKVADVHLIQTNLILVP